MVAYFSVEGGRFLVQAHALDFGQHGLRPVQIGLLQKTLELAAQLVLRHSILSRTHDRIQINHCQLRVVLFVLNKSTVTNFNKTLLLLGHNLSPGSFPPKPGTLDN